MKKNYLYLLAFSAVLFSCTVDEEKPDDVRKPGISINMPAVPDTVFTSGQTMKVRTTLSDNDRISEVAIELIKESDSSHFVHYVLQPNIAFVDVDTSIVLTVTEHANFTLRITGTDPSQNKQVKMQRIHVMP